MVICKKGGRMMKKLLTAFLALVVLSTANACGSSANNAPGSENTATPGSDSSQSTAASADAPTNSTEDSEWVPEKDITFVVPFDAGGTADIPARIVAKYMTKYSTKPITVVNMPGSGGRVGAKEVQNMPADGHTIMHVPVGWYMQYALGIADFTYLDYEPVTLWADSWLALVVSADSPYNTYEEFITAVKADPTSFKIGAVTGTLPILAELSIAQKEGVEFNIVDFGTGAKAPELLGGRVDAYMDGLGAVQQYIDGGQFKCLAVVSHERLVGFEDVPAFSELGYSDFDYLLQSFGMWAPKGTPKPAIEYMANLIKQASEDPDCQKELENLSYGATYMTPEDYAVFCEKVLSDTISACESLVE